MHSSRCSGRNSITSLFSQISLQTLWQLCIWESHQWHVKSWGSHVFKFLGHTDYNLQRRPQVQFLNLLFFIPKWQKAILRTPLGTSKLLSTTLFYGALTDIYAYHKSLHTQFQSRPIVEASEPNLHWCLHVQKRSHSLSQCLVRLQQGSQTSMLWGEAKLILWTNCLFERFQPHFTLSGHMLLRHFISRLSLRIFIVK